MLARTPNTPNYGGGSVPPAASPRWKFKKPRWLRRGLFRYTDEMIQILLSLIIGAIVGIWAGYYLWNFLFYTVFSLVWMSDGDPGYDPKNVQNLLPFLIAVTSLFAGAGSGIIGGAIAHWLLFDEKSQ